MRPGRLATPSVMLLLSLFIIINSSNIASVHPALYTDRNEPSFMCDNGFKVVSRSVTIRSKRTEVINQYIRQNLILN